MLYRVLAPFEDIEDNRHRYSEGDTYPREGLEPKAARIRKLSSKNNARKMRLIEPIEEVE